MKNLINTTKDILKPSENYSLINPKEKISEASVKPIRLDSKKMERLDGLFSPAKEGRFEKELKNIITFYRQEGFKDDDIISYIAYMAGAAINKYDYLAAKYT